jgi:hypothetical protein
MDFVNIEEVGINRPPRGLLFPVSREPVMKGNMILNDAETHPTSIAVWDIVSPVQLSTIIKIRVGAKCSKGCNLANSQIVIHNSQGTQIAMGVLGDTLYSAAVALYWTEIKLVAPAATGIHTWKATLSTAEQEPAHAKASIDFNINVVEMAENTVTIVAVGQHNQNMLTDAHIMLRPYSGYTDNEGMLTLKVADGHYELYVTKDRYEDYTLSITVTGDVTLRVELEPSLYEEDYRGNLKRVRKG